MDAPEPLIASYGLKAWENPNYRGEDPLKIGKPVLKATYNGLIRHLTDDDSGADDDGQTDATKKSETDV
jgi:hypothetical protein